MASSISSFAFSILILSTTGFLPLLVSGMGGFSIDLIHRDSPNSPLYDSSSKSPFRRIKAAAQRSFTRAIYFHNSMQKIPSSFASAPSVSSDSMYSEIMSNSFEYLMSFYIGSPAKEIIASVDTGSDLIWIQCKPCKECYQQTAPFFDPKTSSTYKEISCDADTCLVLPMDVCGLESECEYHNAYGDGSFVDGFLATETLNFNSSGGRRVQIPSVLFGCTHRSNGTFDKRGSGFIGLGGGKISLIRQLGSAIEGKFSYCLPSIDQISATSRINFGSSAVISDNNSVTTPLIPGSPDTLYFLSLDQISVDGQGSVLMKPTMKVASNINQGNIVIDSGTTLTLLDDETLQSVANKVATSGLNF